jgi:tetratricopeptide (TPR) repeat protein|tara:strand:- start:2727 stop:4532 length:1806 start_codon:yes stop_codon:yes gene_type:complete
MKNFNILKLSLVVLILISGCNPLKKMIALSEQQQINVNPNPIELAGSEVSFDVESTLPVGMLPKGTSYTLNFDFEGTQVGSVEFRASDYPNSTSSVSKNTKTITVAYDPSLMGGNPGKLNVKGTAKVVATGKSLDTESSDVADGVNTTITFTRATNIPTPTAYPGYTDAEETEVTTVDFYFNQGSSYLRGSEKKSDRGEQFSAFVAEKNMTKGVNITGAHSPEGSTKVNESLAGRRANAIEKYYRAEMDRYDYKDEAGEINFDLLPVVENWDALRRALRASTSLSREDRSQIGAIINGGGSFVDKEKSLSKLSSYKTLMKEVYPDLRTARTEVTTVIEKKPNNEILAIAQNIVSGESSSEALSHGELLFAGGLTPDLSEKAAIYGAAVKWGGTWQAHNDFGAVHIMLAKQEEEGSESQLKLLEAAKTQLDISNNKKENAESHLNLAAIAAMQYDWNLANEHINKAAGLDLTYAEGMYNMAKGTILIPLGDYENALNHLNKVGQRGWAKWRKGIVQLMSYNFDEAKKEMAALRKQFKESGWKENGGIDYVHAIISAREGDSNAVAENLKTALSKDENGMLKERLVNDVEFINFSDAVKAAMN